jgi:hypothetical protein
MGDRTANKLTVQVCDMSEDDTDHAKKTIIEAFESEREERKIAHKIKTEFDKSKSK